MCIVVPPSYIFPKATWCVEWSPSTYKPIVDITSSTCSSPNGLVVVSALLPLVLTRAANRCIFASIGGDYCDPFWDNSSLMTSFNSCFIFSRLLLFYSSNSFLHSSLRLSIISFLHFSLRFPIISTNCCWLMDVEELLEARGVFPKYRLMVMPDPAARTRPACSGCLMVLLSMSSQPWGTKLSCVVRSSNDLTILSDISCAAVDVIYPYRFELANFHLTCLSMGDGGSSINGVFSISIVSCLFFFFSSISFFLSKS